MNTPTYTLQLGTKLKLTPAYQNPEARTVIEKILAAMSIAQSKGKDDMVNVLIKKLTDELNRIFAASQTHPTAEALNVIQGLQTGYGERLNELDAFGIIDKRNAKIKAIDNKEYPSPSWQDIQAAITPEKMNLILQLEKPTLLLVPDGMSLSEYLTKAGSDKSLPKRKLPWSKVSDIDVDSDKNGLLFSGVTKYEKVGHGGKKKIERLQETGARGWQVFVVDGGDEVPASTLEKNADTLLQEFREQGFEGLSAEAYFALQMYGQTREKQFDINKWGWLLGSYIPDFPNMSRGVVLCSDWYGSRVRLFRRAPDVSDGYLGARRAVRVL